MKYYSLTFLILFIGFQINAQQKAVTESGKTVILFENGTWQYEEALKQAVSNLEKTPVSEIVVTKYSVDSTKNVKSERKELFYDKSPKMAKYFGETKGKNRCFTTCFNNEGEVVIKFEINVPVGDGNRYFGYSLKDRIIKLELINGNTIFLSITKDLEEKFLSKYNQSFFIGSAILKPEEIDQLITSPILKVHVDWKKNPETYEAERSGVLQESLKEII